jgi:dTDP-4-amino-4,6-dideoxygalactose transaminase
MNSRIFLSSPHMGGEESKFIKNAFENNWIAPLGPNVDGFETDLAAFTGVKHAAALSSGTAAIHLALIMLGIKAGDEVVCQSMTFSASANPIAYMGATPVFVDSETDTWNMDPNLLEDTVKARQKAGKRIQAIIPVHLYGMPAKMREIAAVASKYAIPVIEDAAEALGSGYRGQPCGSFGKIGILSFNGNKIITTSGGGALLSNDAVLVKKARFLATQARDPAPHYQHSEIGYNYRMSNICAGIGRGQMEVLPERVRQRRAVYDFYRELLSGKEGISFLPEPEEMFSNRWLTTILVDPARASGVTREDIRMALESENIESRPLWKPMHLQPVFRDAPATINGTSERVFANGLCLPSGSNLQPDEKKRIADVLKKLLK